MNVAEYFQGENPLNDETADATSIPSYAIFFMAVIISGVVAQYGVNKIQGILGVGNDSTQVEVV